MSCYSEWVVSKLTDILILQIPPSLSGFKLSQGKVFTIEQVAFNIFSLISYLFQTIDPGWHMQCIVKY